MAKRARKNGGDGKGGSGEVIFPEAIIHHLQSYLNAKKAAQTSVISKSWYSAWLTCPAIDLNEEDFKKRIPDNELAFTTEGFRDFAWKTMRRYKAFNLRVETIRLRVCTTGLDSISFIVEFLKEVVKMGVKDIALCSCGLDFALPYQLFESDMLERLSLRSMLIHGPPPGEVVKNSNIKSLTLEHMPVEPGCFLHIFPFVEDLAIRHCHFVNETIQVSSASLKYISLNAVHKLEAIFDVPNIRKFKFRSLYCHPWFPSFSTIPKEVQFDLELCMGNCIAITKSWYYKLRDFLKKLSESKVCLTISGSVSCHYITELKGKQGHVVENLILLPSSPWKGYSALFVGLLWGCPPKFITLFWSPISCLSEKEKESNDLIMFLCAELIQKGNESWGVRRSIRHGSLDLGRVSFECLDTNLVEWWPLPWKTLLSDSNCPKGKLKVRFKLEWREKAPWASENQQGRTLLNNEPSDPSTRLTLNILDTR